MANIDHQPIETSTQGPTTLTRRGGCDQRTRRGMVTRCSGQAVQVANKTGTAPPSLGLDGREHRGTAGAGRVRGAPRLPCARV
jgi:hypothetical protein